MKLILSFSLFGCKQTDIKFNEPITLSMAKFMD